jgi:hypothetical protein
LFSALMKNPAAPMTNVATVIAPGHVASVKGGHGGDHPQCPHPTRTRPY